MDEEGYYDEDKDEDDENDDIVNHTLLIMQLLLHVIHPHSLKRHIRSKFEAASVFL